MDTGTERKEMCEHHPQPEDRDTITSILGSVFSVEKEEEITIQSLLLS